MYIVSLAENFVSELYKKLFMTKREYSTKVLMRVGFEPTPRRTR